MKEKNRLEGKQILIVDDEPDVLDVLEELLTMCKVKKASSFDEARDLILDQSFDMAILDIMGVDGYKLLEMCRERKIIAVMLTANALNPDNIIKSYKEGAASYIPKDKITDITTFLNDILEGRERGRHFWWRWLERVTESYCEKKFGPDWQKKDEAFWEKFKYDLSE